MRVAKVVVVLVALSASVTVHAGTYQWRDGAGVTHFTDNADNIPNRYLNSVKELPSIKAPKQTSPATTSSTPSVTTSSTDAAGRAKEQAKQEEYKKLSNQLKTLQDGLPAKKDELVKLRHKFVVRKGRVPSAKEIKKFESKRTSGSDTAVQNPYVNKNSLTSVGPARAAYYQKLEEVRMDEARIQQLQKELSAMTE